MDRVTDGAWRATESPFDGVTLFASDLPTPRLFAAAARVVELLEARFPAVVLHSSEDWLEHDGFVTEPEPASWDGLRASVTTVEAFIEASPWDTYVRRAWHGQGAFYLRWHYYDERDSPLAADPPAGGDLDLTANPALVDHVARELVALGVQTERQEAKSFFDARWNG